MNGSRWDDAASGAASLAGRVASRSRPSAWLFGLLLGACCNSPAADAAEPLDCGTRAGRAVDVLWVVQDSGSSSPLRGRAASFVGPLVSALGAAGAGEIRMALTTGSVGPAGAMAPDCPRDAAVLDGVLLDRGDGTGPVFGASPTEIVRLSERITTLADAGCGNSLFEAAVRAVAPADFDLPIGVAGAFHGDAENAGFVRGGDLVLVVLVTTQDDCSWNGSVVPGETLEEACMGVGVCCDEVVHPIVRYVEAFRRIEARLGVDMVLASITSAPEPDVSIEEWRTRSPRACRDVAGAARMPWRILETTDALRPEATSQSLCAVSGPAEYEARAAAIAERVVTAGCD